jgi:hypothetical protein
MRPVFIVGTGRSGTSLLYRTIVLHSDFFVGEVCLEESRVFAESTRILQRLHAEEKNPLYEYMLRDDELFQAFVGAVYKTAVIQRVPDAVTRRCWGWPYPLRVWSAMGGRRIVNEFFRHAKAARGGKRIVEKTPSHVKCIEYMFSEFPECRMLSTVRHPIDVYTSYVRRRETEHEDWLNVSVESFVRRYREDMREAEKYANNERFRTVDYDNFTRRPERTFEGICDFLGVEFESDPIEGNVPSLSDWKPDPYLSEPISPSTKKPEKYISESDARKTQTRLKSTMER